MEKTVGGPDGHGFSPPGRGEGGSEPSKFFSLGKMQRVFKSPPKPLIMNHGNGDASCLNEPYTPNLFGYPQVDSKETFF